jgi:ubiquinone/menaquinone biosynthesis C-methylase UbiE
VLELGAGTGHNLPYYTDAVSELVMTEPDPHMARRLRERLADEPAAAWNPTVVEAPAEQLPFDDGSFDTVVATLVLCTVEDPPRALAEARRVLVEGGRLLYLEHVRSTRPGLGRWQDLLQRPWGFFAGGCHPNRPTDQTIADAGFWIDSLERDKLPKAPPLVRPLIHGVARRPSGVGSG